MGARFKTPGPGTYRPPSDFGYLDFQSQFKTGTAPDASQQFGNSRMTNGYQTSRMAETQNSFMNRTQQSSMMSAGEKERKERNARLTGNLTGKRKGVSYRFFLTVQGKDLSSLDPIRVHDSRKSAERVNLIKKVYQNSNTNVHAPSSPGR